ncbi:hypothetical protein GCM10018782_29270 [Streptomyces griseoaurantiacus]|nr:hypothetical protein GCM10018782_29270 [Streptomyces griseoaurantiacus]
MPDMIPHLPPVWGGNPGRRVRAGRGAGKRPVGARAGAGTVPATRRDRFRVADGHPKWPRTHGSCCGEAMTSRAASGLTAGGSPAITLASSALPPSLTGTRDT